MKKRGLVMAAAVMVSVLSASTAFAAGWGMNKDFGSDWCWQQEDGSYAANQWKEVNGKYYYFDANGCMLADTVTPDGYTVDADGAWVPEKGQNLTALSKDTDLSGYLNTNLWNLLSALGDMKTESTFNKTLEYTNGAATVSANPYQQNMVSENQVLADFIEVRDGYNLFGICAGDKMADAAAKAVKAGGTLKDDGENIKSYTLPEGRTLSIFADDNGVVTHAALLRSGLLELNLQ